jgi:hypothetical protein
MCKAHVKPTLLMKSRHTANIATTSYRRKWVRRKTLPGIRPPKKQNNTKM